jgi:hypothetical protein
VAGIENGEGASLANLIVMLRALNSLDTLESFLPAAEPRREAGARSAAAPFPAGDLWKWGASAG